MSHFAVMVIGPDPERLLAPYHEFECTGKDDDFVVDVDETAKYRAKYDTKIDDFVADAAGTLSETYDDRWYRAPTTSEQQHIDKHAMSWGNYCTLPSGLSASRAARVWRVRDPEGFGGTPVKRPVKEVKTFRQYIADDTKRAEVVEGDPIDRAGKHKFGYTVIDANGAAIMTYGRTNPNKKWDWYTLGGRWSGWFKLRNGDKVDATTWGKVDVKGMQDDAERRAYEHIAPWIAVLKQHPRPIGWHEVFDKHDADRAMYRAQPAIAAYNELSNSWDCPVDSMGFDVEVYVQRQRAKALLPFAILDKDGWHERGEMGWWGVVLNEQGDWEERAGAILAKLDPNEQVAIYDCHI